MRQIPHGVQVPRSVTPKNGFTSTLSGLNSVEWEEVAKYLHPRCVELTVADKIGIYAIQQISSILT